MFEVKMPQWGMDMTEGTVLQWLKKVGDRVEKGEPLAEIETAKSVNTLEAPVAGVVSSQVVQVEETVPVQALLATIDDGR